MKKYKFVRYNPTYVKLFRKERGRLKKILQNSKIEHIGSTAVKGLSGKGIIDVLISVQKKELEKAKNKLINNGYIFKEKGGDKNRVFFEKDYKYAGKKRRVHLQLTSNNSLIWKNAILFRDKLREDYKKAREYEQIKKIAVKKAKGDGKIYRKCKEKFI